MPRENVNLNIRVTGAAQALREIESIREALGDTDVPISLEVEGEDRVRRELQEVQQDLESIRSGTVSARVDISDVTAKTAQIKGDFAAAVQADARVNVSQAQGDIQRLGAQLRSELTQPVRTRDASGRFTSGGEAGAEPGGLGGLLTRFGGSLPVTLIGIASGVLGALGLAGGQVLAATQADPRGTTAADAGAAAGVIRRLISDPNLNINRPQAQSLLRGLGGVEGLGAGRFAIAAEFLRADVLNRGYTAEQASALTETIFRATGGDRQETLDFLNQFLNTLDVSPDLVQLGLGREDIFNQDALRAFLGAREGRPLDADFGDTALLLRAQYPAIFGVFGTEQARQQAQAVRTPATRARDLARDAADRATIELLDNALGIAETNLNAALDNEVLTLLSAQERGPLPSLGLRTRGAPAAAPGRVVAPADVLRTGGVRVEQAAGLPAGTGRVVLEPNEILAELQRAAASVQFTNLAPSIF